MKTFGPSDPRDPAGPATSRYAEVAAAVRDALDAAVGPLAWTEPQPAHTYTDPATGVSVYQGVKHWGRDVDNSEQSRRRCVAALSRVLPEYGFGLPEVGEDPSSDALLVSAMGPDQVRFEFRGRWQLAFWVELPCPQ